MTKPDRTAAEHGLRSFSHRAPLCRSVLFGVFAVPRVSFHLAALPAPPAILDSSLLQPPRPPSLLPAMNQANKQTTGQESVASRTNIPTRMHVEEKGNDQRVQKPSTPASPVMRLHRHALESIFAMLTLEGLAQVLAVSQSWSVAVRSMKSIQAVMERDGRSTPAAKRLHPFPRIVRIVASPLLRHLGAIQLRAPDRSLTRLKNASLALLAQHAPNLQSLHCELRFTSVAPLIWPAKLQSLHLKLDRIYTDTQINGVLMTLAALPLLSRLHLSFLAFEHVNSIDLSVLAACPSLSDLALGTFNGGSPKLTDAQVHHVRVSFGHLHRFSLGWCTFSDDLTRLLEPPVTARWRDIGHVYADKRTGDLLLRLPTLTTLHLDYDEDAEHVDFLSQLPFLTALKLDCYNAAVAIPPDAVFAALLRCTGLTDLRLTCGLKAAQ